jgi:multiple sugar transport system substrate-binding protein
VRARVQTETAEDATRVPDRGSSFVIAHPMASATPSRERRRRLLLAALAAPLAGCGPRAPAEGERTLLVFKHGKLFGDPGAMRALLDAFERRHPRFEVREETLPSSSDDQHQFYAINLQSRSGEFDVFAVDVIWVAGFAQAGWLRDVSTLLPAVAHSAFFGGALQSVTFHGRAYAIPWFVDAGLLYYREDLLARYGRAPPRTWGELVHTAQAVMPRAPGVEGFVWQGKQYEGLVCNVLEFLRSNGGDVLDGARVVLDTAPNREALAFMADLVHRLHVTPASVTTATEEPTRHLFGQGRAIFMRNWPYAWRLFRDEGSRVHGRVGVTTLPHFEGGVSAATLGGWQLAVNAHSRHPEAATKLVRYLTSTAVQKQLALAYGFQPSRVELYRDADLLAQQPFLGTLADVFASARPRPVTPRYVRVSQVLQSEFSAAISGLKTPAAALAAGQRGLERLLADERRARV